MRTSRIWKALPWTAAALLAVGCGGLTSSAPSAPGTSPGTPAAASPSASAVTSAPSATAPASSSPSKPPGAALWLQSLQMSTSSTGWALYFSGNPMTAPLGTPTLLVRTMDAARTWDNVTPPAAIAMLSAKNAGQVLDAVGPDRAYLAVTASSSDSGPATTRVFATDDGGRTWTESAPVEAPGAATGLSFTDPSHGWLLVNEGAAMGRDAVRVYRTTDGGARWSLAAQSPTFNSNSDSSAGISLACDKTGIMFPSAAAGWLTSECTAGLAGELLVSRDGGVTWAAQPLPLPANVCGDTGCVLAGPEFTGGAGFLTVSTYGGEPALLVSRDLGQTWQSMALPPGSGVYPQVRFFDQRRGVLVSAGSQGSFGRVFYTTSDGGQTWTAVPQGRHFTQLGVAFDFVSPVTGFAWINGGDAQGSTPPPVYETTDSGRTWTSFSPRLAG